MTAPRCGRLDCDDLAEFAVKTPYEKAVLRCGGHAEETAAVYDKFANRQNGGCRVTSLTRREKAGRS